mgnify:CR=1 FL=1
MNDVILWVEKYRPHKISDCVLPSDLSEPFSEFVEQGKVPNLILTGGPGTGKTTAARALCDETKTDYLMVNGSDEGRNIDTVRTTLNQFCSSISMTGNRKAIIMDEADYMNPDSVQPALRGFIEKFGNNVSFLFTCNYPTRIIDPIHSRCSVLDFSIPVNEKPKIGTRYLERCCQILEENEVEYDKRVVRELVGKHFGDFRRIINELQKYSASGKIDAGILSTISEINVSELVNYLKNKKFSEMRKWANSNMDTDVVRVFRKMYDVLNMHLKPQSVPQAVLIIADYQYKSAFISDQEVNLVAFLTQVMADCEFK